jgi:DNA repair protein RecN (Recombination protein N)
MLSHLKVENFAVVEKAEIDFSPHLNIFTGETGAGKSILIDAISLFLNKKLSDNVIRSGTDKLIVEALFTRSDDEFVLRREIRKSKSVSYLNGEMVPFQLLKEKAENLLNIYGQNEHIFLLQTGNHRVYLDRFSGNGEYLDQLSRATIALKELIRKLNDLKSRMEQLKEKLELIEFQINEIENLRMGRGEDQTLLQRQKILGHSEEILSRSQNLVQEWYQNENSIYNQISQSLKDLAYLKNIYPELVGFEKEITNFYNTVPEFSSLLSSIQSGVEYNEEELNEIQDRLAKLNRLKSKHDLDLDGLIDKCEVLKKERESLLGIEISLNDTRDELDLLLKSYKEIHLKIRQNRRKKAGELSRLVEKELSQLEMKRAQFTVDFEEIEPDFENFSDKGTDKMEFYFSSNPGQQPGKIKDVISGGELSRLMLVLKSIVEDEAFSTYIFDEIDSGIGGKTAQFVGEKLKRISRSNQVICISHLPQIASLADRHFLIQKEFRNNQTFSFTRELSGEETVEEIARLMAGRDINENVLAAARNLLSASKTRS